MATSRQITVTTTPQLVGRVDEGSLSIWVHAGGTMYFGGDNTVTTSTGFRLDKDDKFGTVFPEGNEVWVVCGVGVPPILYVFATVI